MINQAEIHRKTMSSEIRERINAVNQILSNFAVLPDKKQAWDDLHRLTKDEDGYRRRGIAYSLQVVSVIF